MIDNTDPFSPWTITSFHVRAICSKMWKKRVIAWICQIQTVWQSESEKERHWSEMKCDDVPMVFLMVYMTICDCLVKEPQRVIDLANRTGMRVLKGFHKWHRRHRNVILRCMWHHDRNARSSERLDQKINESHPMRTAIINKGKNAPRHIRSDETACSIPWSAHLPLILWGLFLCFSGSFLKHAEPFYNLAQLSIDLSGSSLT
jgi:hypothetical protein